MTENTVKNCINIRFSPVKVLNYNSNLQNRIFDLKAKHETSLAEFRRFPRGKFHGKMSSTLIFVSRPANAHTNYFSVESSFFLSLAPSSLREFAPKFNPRLNESLSIYTTRVNIAFRR